MVASTAGTVFAGCGIDFVGGFFACLLGTCASRVSAGRGPSSVFRAIGSGRFEALVACHTETGSPILQR